MTHKANFSYTPSPKTEFLSITRESLADDQSAGATVESNGNGEMILVVDDIEEQRQIATLMLKKLGYDVNSVSGGEEAIEFLQDHSADLLVLDMIMDPGIDGLETYKQILQINPDQKAIIASGFSETWRVKEAQRLGAGAYVKKPYTIEKIEQAVTAELGK